MPSARAHVEEHAAADHLVLGLLDAALRRAERRHLAAVVAVPHVVLVEHVAEAVPLRAALQRHHHHVVGGADAALVEHAGIGVGAGAQHGVQRIDAAEHRILGLAALRAVVVEVERERDHLALLHQLRRGDDVLRPRVVERADLVVGAPLAPVLVLLGGVAEVLSRDFTGGHGVPSGFMIELLADDSIAERTGEEMMSAWTRAASVAREPACEPRARGHGRRRDLSDEIRPRHRAVRGGRADRRDRAPGRAAADRSVGPSGLHREYSRRRRQHRSRHGGARRAGRLHHSGREHGLHRQPEHVHENPVRPDQGFCADLAGGRIAQYRVRQSASAGKIVEGARSTW